MYQRNDEIKRLPGHFRAKSLTQCQKTRLDVKVLGLSVVEMEKIDCFKPSPNLKSIENLWRELISAIAKRTPANLKSLITQQWKSGRKLNSRQV